MRRDDALPLIAEHRAELAEDGVTTLSVFGSVARDEAGPDSNVDFLIRLDPGRTLLDLVAIKQDLQAAVHN